MRFISIFLTIIAILAAGSAQAELKVKRSLSNTPHGFVKLTAPVRAGRLAHLFEVRAGDCGKDRYWNDCKTDRERSEVWLPNDSWKPGGFQWVGYSIYVPSDFQVSDPVVTTAGQIHMQGGPTNTREGFKSTPGLLLMNLDRHGYTACVIIIKGPRNDITDTCQHIFIASLNQMKGRWTDIQIGIDTSIAGGNLEIWANGTKVGTATGFNFHLPKEYNFKYGIYRSFVSRYGGPMPTQQLVFDEIRMGGNRQSVVVDTTNPVN